MDNVVIEAANLTKYRPTSARGQRPVLVDLNLTVARGESYGLIGPNGAGKSTTVKLLLGILHSDSGRAAILGHPAGSAQALAKIGFLPENPSFYNHLTGREFLTLCGKLAAIEAQKLHGKIDELLHRLSLAQYAAEPIGRYSLGTQQRLGLAQALLGDPDVLFLDEPMNGLDPIGRASVRDLLKELKAQGKTIFLTSHLLNDVEVLCDRCGVLAEGKLLTQGTITDLLASGKYSDLDQFFLQTIKAAEVSAPSPSSAPAAGGE